MNLEEIQNQINIISSDNDLSVEQKQIRIKILKTFLHNMAVDNTNKKIIEEYKNIVNQFISNTGIEIISELADDIFKNFIIQSYTYQQVSKKNSDCMLDEIEIKMENYEPNNKNLILAIEAYKSLEKIKKEEASRINSMSSSLNEILKNNMVKPYTEIGALSNNASQSHLIRHEKDKRQLKMSQGASVETARKLYADDNILDFKTYTLTLNMIQQIFRYYENGTLIQLDDSLSKTRNSK